MMTIADKLARLGHPLPAAPAPAANYVTATHHGELWHFSGQIGHAGHNAGDGGTDLATLKAAAESAALALLAHIDAVTGGRAERVERILRLGVFIAAGPGFTRHGAVADGASDLLVAVFGDAGRHARTSIGVASLPQGALVELDAQVIIRAPQP